MFLFHDSVFSENSKEKPPYSKIEATVSVPTYMLRIFLCFVCVWCPYVGMSVYACVVAFCVVCECLRFACELSVVMLCVCSGMCVFCTLRKALRLLCLVHFFSLFYFLFQWLLSLPGQYGTYDDGGIGMDTSAVLPSPA